MRRRDAAHRPAERAADRDARQSGRLRRLARRAGRADDPLLRPLRRAAGRSAGPVAVAAVRGDGPRRRDLRARRGRRQGPGVHALQGDRSAPEAERPAAGEHQVHSSKARRKSAACNLDDFIRAHKERARAPTSSSSPTRRCSTAACRRSATACAAWSTSRSICAARSTDLHSGSFGGAVANPGVRARADARADEGSRRPHQDPRLLRRCAWR